MPKMIMKCIGTALGCLVLSAVNAFAPSSARPRLPPLRRPSLCRRRGGFQRPAVDIDIVEYDDFLPQPNPAFDALDVVKACMDVLNERKDAGLEVCFHFSSDRCRAALGGSLERFAEYATNPVFGYLVNCVDYEIVSVGPVIAGTPTRGAMQTVLMDVRQKATSSSLDDSSDDGGDDNDNDDNDNRRFLWTLQKERRPPRQDCWGIHEVIYVKNAFDLTT